MAFQNCFPTISLLKMICHHVPYHIVLMDTEMTPAHDMYGSPKSY